MKAVNISCFIKDDSINKLYFFLVGVKKNKVGDYSYYFYGWKNVNVKKRLTFTAILYLCIYANFCNIKKTFMNKLTASQLIHEIIDTIQFQWPGRTLEVKFSIKDLDIDK